MLKRRLLAICLLSLWTFTLTACVSAPLPEASPTVPPPALPTTSPTVTPVVSVSPQFPSTVPTSPTITEQPPTATTPSTTIPQPEIPEQIESAPSDSSTPITVRLILSKAPRLNESADLTLIVSSILDAPGTTATILLPDGAVLTDGDLEWAGDLPANEPLTLQATIMFVSEGNWIIEGKALRTLDNGNVWGDAGYIYIHVSKEAGRVGFPTEPPLRPSGEEVPSPPPVEPSP